jgi:hypothetical protein
LTLKKENGPLASSSGLRTRKKKGPLMAGAAKTSAGRPTPIAIAEIFGMAAPSPNIVVGQLGEVHFKKKR